MAYKAGQMGLSEYAVSYAMHAADARKATVLYVFPTNEHVSDFSSARIGPAIEASPYLGSIVIDGGGEGGDEKKRGADRVTLKRIGNRFIYLRGAKVQNNGSAPQLKSIDADVLVLDEVDEMDPRALPIAEKRLGHSDIGEIRYISTPTYAGYGIHAEWLKSDQREWHVQCAACGEWQPLTINQAVIEWDQLGRPVRWHGQAAGRAFLACRRCAAAINRLGAGRWIAARPGIETVGFHFTKLFSRAVSLDTLIESLQTVDETKRKETYNQDLGETYTPRGGQITDEVLDECRRDYAHGPRHKEGTVMGADVGKVIHAVIRGDMDPETGERPQYWAGEIDTFDELIEMMHRYNVVSLVIDALPETTMCRQVQAAFRPGTVYLAYYNQNKLGSKQIEPIGWDVEEGVVNLDRTRTLDQTFALVTSGLNTLPAHARDVKDYYAHLKAPVRVIEDGPGGVKVARYVESGPDHLAHAENYCRIAYSAPRPPETVYDDDLRVSIGY